MSRFTPFLLVTWREIRDRTDSFSYRASTLVLVVLAALGIIAADALPRLFEDEERLRLGFVAGEGLPGVQAALPDSAAEFGLTLTIVPFGSREEAEEALRRQRVEAVLQGDELLFEADEDVTLTAAVNRALFLARLPAILDRLGLDLQQALPLLSPERAQVRRLTEPSDEDEEGRRNLAFFATIALYLSLTLYGAWILQGVVEEKTSRVAEVLLGLMSADQLLAGKTVGVLSVAVLQLALTVAGALLGLAVTGGVDLPSLALDMAAGSVTYFVLGLLLYSLAFAAVGSTVNRQSEAQSAAMPVTLLLLLPYLVSIVYLPEHPDSGLVTALSLLPLSSPLIMPGRIAVGSPSAIELVVSLALLVASLFAVVWLAGRIYAAAMLMNRRASLTRMIGGVLAGRRPE